MLFPRLKSELRKASSVVAGQVCSGAVEIVSINQNVVRGKKTASPLGLGAMVICTRGKYTEWNQSFNMMGPKLMS